MISMKTICVTFALAAAGCSPDPAQEADAPENGALGPGEVATVNGSRIPESVFRLYTLNATQQDADSLNAEERQRIIDDLIYLLVLAQEGEAQGIPDERAIAAELELLRWQAIARAVTLRFREENPATEAELRALYEENLPRLAGTQFKARHILVETQEEADQIIEQLNEGGDFEALANEHSTDSDGTSGGDLGWFAAESMVPPFAEAVRAMPIGAYSDAPVQTQYGWHVILVEDSRDQQAPGIDSVRADLTAAVERQKLDAYVTRLREAAVVALDER